MTRGSLAFAVTVVLLATGSQSAARSMQATADIYSIAVNGSDQRDLTNTPAVLENWVSRSPDGARLAFFRQDAVYVMKVDGSALRRIASGHPPPDFAAAPAWSPNSRELAFARGVGCTEVVCQRLELEQANVETGQVRRIARAAVEPAWSHDGRWLAYTHARLVMGREPSFRLSVVVARADGSRARTIARGASYPSWSPSGRFIAYVGHNGFNSVNLYRARRDGSARRRLSRLGVYDVLWSPDPGRLAFVGGLGTSDIYAIGAEGRGLRRLGAIEYDDSFSWSPDGRSLVWPRGKRLVIASADGRSHRELPLETQTRVTSPVWSTDGKRIFFVA